MLKARYVLPRQRSAIFSVQTMQARHTNKIKNLQHKNYSRVLKFSETPLITGISLMISEERSANLNVRQAILHLFAILFSLCRILHSVETSQIPVRRIFLCSWTNSASKYSKRLLYFHTYTILLVMFRDTSNYFL